MKRTKQSSRMLEMIQQQLSEAHMSDPTINEATKSLEAMTLRLQDARRIFIRRRNLGMTAHTYEPNGECSLAGIFDEIEGCIQSLKDWYL